MRTSWRWRRRYVQVARRQSPTRCSFPFPTQRRSFERKRLCAASIFPFPRRIASCRSFASMSARRLSWSMRTSRLKCRATCCILSSELLLSMLVAASMSCSHQAVLSRHDLPHASRCGRSCPVLRAASSERAKLRAGQGSIASSVSIWEGRRRMSLRSQYVRKVRSARAKSIVAGGIPCKGVPMLDIHTAGAGGGSIARFDSGGMLRVGPESAGSEPGPICFGRGTLPTVTDANLLLGRLDADSFLGGGVRLDRERTEQLMHSA